MHYTPLTLSALLVAATSVSASPWGFPRSSTHTVTATPTTITNTVTVTSGTASTGYSFVRGNPPSTSSTPSNSTSSTPSIAPSVNGNFIFPRPSGHTVTITPTSTLTVTKTASPTPIISTVYPCSNASIAYGTASYSGPSGSGIGPVGGSGALMTANNKYSLSSAQGADVVGCCEACLFDTENCVQAWWYSYEGCVVQQAVNVTATTGGKDVSKTCPQGKIEGLTYGNDSSPAFHSTGNIIGGCGVGYDAESFLDE